MASHEIKKIDYGKALRDSGKSNLFGSNMTDDGAELISNLLNDVNNRLWSNMKQAYELEPKICKTSHYHRAKKVIEKVFAGSMEKLAVSEAYRQLVLHESGCIAYKYDSGLSTLPKTSLSDKPEPNSPSSAPERLNFSTAVTDLFSVFEIAHISLARDSKMKICNILEEVCDALVSHSIAAVDSKELGLKEIKASVCELFPGSMTDLAVFNGLKTVKIWEDSNSESHSPTSVASASFEHAQISLARDL